MMMKIELCVGLMMAVGNIGMISWLRKYKIIFLPIGRKIKKEIKFIK